MNGSREDRVPGGISSDAAGDITALRHSAYRMSQFLRICGVLMVGCGLIWLLFSIRTAAAFGGLGAGLEAMIPILISLVALCVWVAMGLALYFTGLWVGHFSRLFVRIFEGNERAMARAVRGNE